VSDKIIVMELVN